MAKRTEVIIVDELRAARALQKGYPLEGMTAYKNSCAITGTPRRAAYAQFGSQPQGNGP
jgi:hypothetical protein